MLRQCYGDILTDHFAELAGGKPGWTFRAACGPVSAAIAACVALGWAHKGGARRGTLGGREIDFNTCSADSAKRLAGRDAELIAWRRAAARHRHLAHLEGPPHLETARRLVSDRSVLPPSQRGLLKAFLAGKFFRFSVCRCGERFDDAERCWAHFAWECPLTEELRSTLTTPMHSASASSYPGAPTDFVEKIRNFSHTAWVQTALLPDPRQHDPPAASPGIIRWDLHPHDERLFAGTCCGDASCTLGGARPELSARAAWAVCEVNEHFKNRRLCIHRTAAGTLPGPVQSAEGAELFALVFWLRHLDPSSPAVPRFVTDCERVYDG